VAGCGDHSESRRGRVVPGTGDVPENLRHLESARRQFLGESVGRVVTVPDVVGTGAFRPDDVDGCIVKAPAVSDYLTRPPCTWTPDTDTATEDVRDVC
jgi:hypothetical protein